MQKNEPYNYSDLLGKIRAKGITQEELARKIHLNPSTLSQKLNNCSEFSQSEMREICKVLDIRIESVANYFFCNTTLENAS